MERNEAIELPILALPEFRRRPSRLPEHSMARTAEHEGNQAVPSPEELAVEYIARLSSGDPGEKQGFLARLPDDAARREFETLIRGAERVERSLPRALAAGTELSRRYRILSEIGSGGMGRVFSAVDQHLGRKVAIKVLSSQNMGQQDLEELFLKESKLLASLQHPNIVSVHESGRDGDLAYIVMDLVDGTSLSDVIEGARKELKATSKGDRLSPQNGLLLERAIGRKAPDGRPNLIDAADWYASVARVMLEVARTIEAAHGLRVIHRDLKPGNVMLLGGGNPVVLDFGLAGSSDLKPGTVTQGLYGSVAYLAPEQAHSNQVGMDPRTDVYQLGLIFYELLTLQRAFPGIAIGEVLGRVKDGVFPAPRKVNPAVPRDLESICMMALELDPARRYESAKALRQDLERCVAGTAVPIALRSNRWRALSRSARIQARRHPVHVGVAGMALVAIAITGIFVMRPAPAPQVLSPFFRLNPDEGREVPLPKDHPVVEAGDTLGLNVKSGRSTYVYTLSVYGREGVQRYIAPWRTASPEDPERMFSTAGDWGLPVEPGEQKVLCTRIDAGENNKYEGLLVLSSPVRSPELEEWMTELYKRSTREKASLVTFEEGVQLLESQFPTLRGGKHEGSFTPEQVRKIRANLKAAQRVDDWKKFELPGVDPFAIECSVAGK